MPRLASKCTIPGKPTNCVRSCGKVAIHVRVFAPFRLFFLCILFFHSLPSPDKRFFARQCGHVVKPSSSYLFYTIREIKEPY